MLAKASLYVVEGHIQIGVIRSKSLAWKDRVSYLSSQENEASMPVMLRNDQRESEFPMLRTVLHNLFQQIPSYFAQRFHVYLGRGNCRIIPRKRRQAPAAIEAVEARRMLSGITMVTTFSNNILNSTSNDGISGDSSDMRLTLSMPLMSSIDCILGTTTPILPASGQPTNGAGNNGMIAATTTDPNLMYVSPPLTFGGNFNNTGAPVILIPPVGNCVKNGTSVTLSAEATLSSGVRWIESHDQGITWTAIDDFSAEITFFLSAIEGASSTEIKMTVTLAMNDTLYVAVFSNNAGSTFTTKALMHVFA